jgi:crotonobetainyl-CoA:carnitine CoA-transferase CaiB-like acyl-CoA transferase
MLCQITHGTKYRNESYFTLNSKLQTENFQLMKQALEHIRVLDLSRLLPGGMCTRILADLGAEVLKVEEPGRGDYLRAFPPLDGAQSALFNELNRGKRSLTLNLKTEAGRRVLLELVQRSDILVESFRPGTLARLQLAPEALLQANPRLIVCSVSGFGQNGPLRDRAGHDLNYLGYAGALPLFAPRGGGLPIVPGLQLADYGSGAYAATIGILAALFERERSGRGQWLDIAMTQGLLQWLALTAAELRAAGAIPAGGRGPLSGGYACYSVYATSDGGAITVAAVEPHFWANLCRVIGREQYVALQYAPWPQQAALFADLDALFRTRTRDEWLALFGDADVCVGPVLSLQEALELHGEYAVQIEQPGARQSQQVRGMFGPTAMQAAPLLGEHTDDVLADLGYDMRQIAVFHRSAVV